MRPSQNILSPSFRLQWTTPTQYGVRLLALDDSDFVFLERQTSPSHLTLDSARRIAAVTAPGAVAFVNDDKRIATLVDFAHSDELPRTDFSLIHAIGMAPGLTAQIGSLQRTNKDSTGLWVAYFSPLATDENAVRQALERLVLGPWIERQPMQAVARMYDAEILVSNAHVLMQIKNVRNSLAHWTGSDRSRVDRVKPVVHALDDLEQTLEKSQPPIPVADVPPSPVPPPAQTDDPVRRAVDLRERLQGRVKFVTSAEWARWRGIHSNPAAALGKYKAKKRVFGVRVSKQLRYPKFQFADDAEPLPVIRDILRLVPVTAQGWPLLSWFDAKSTLLQGRKPSDVVATEPQAALNAARRFFSRDD